MKFAFHASAQKQALRLQISHICGVLEASSDDEANGKAMRIAQAVYPSAGGWANHFVGVDDAAFLVTPENAVERWPSKAKA